MTLEKFSGVPTVKASDRPFTGPKATRRRLTFVIMSVFEGRGQNSMLIDVGIVALLGMHAPE
jgi:hypothetical protein